MKRNMELVRALLLRIEASDKDTLPLLPEIEGHTRDEIAHHVKLLIGAGYVQAIDASTMVGADFMEMALTWQGHEFLDTVRDSEIWSNAKSGAKAVGAWSIDLLASLAKGAALAKAQSLGLPLG